MRKVETVTKFKKIPAEIRRGRKAISNCLNSYLLLIKELEKEYKAKEIVFTYDIMYLLKSLLASVDHFNGNVTSKVNDAKVLETKDEQKVLTQLVINTEFSKLLVKNKELQQILRLMQYFKIEEQYGEGHFDLISEDRNIRTVIEHDFRNRDVTFDSIAKFHHDWIPDLYLSATAAESMKWGEAEMEIEEGINIRSSQEISYTVAPSSEFARNLLKINAIPMNLGDQDFQPQRPHYKIGSLGKKETFWSSLIELTKSIFVQYYVILGGFHAVRVCDECNCLLLAKEEDFSSFYKDGNALSATVCSKTCYKIIRRRKFPLIAAREDCFNNQREWLKDRLFKDSIEETASYCKNCPIDLRKEKISRGECPFLSKKYLNEIEAKSILMNGWSYQADLCRKRQIKWYREHVKKSVYRRREECIDCPLMIYPESGDCPFLCEKYGEI